MTIQFACPSSAYRESGEVDATINVNVELPCPKPAYLGCDEGGKREMAFRTLIAAYVFLEAVSFQMFAACLSSPCVRDVGEG